MLNFFFLEHVGSLAEFSQTGGKRKLRLEDLRVGTHVYSPMIKNYHSEKNQGVFILPDPRVQLHLFPFSFI